MLAQFTALLDIFGAAIGLWMAIYVLARGYRSPITQRAVAALLSLATTPLGSPPLSRAWTSKARNRRRNGLLRRFGTGVPKSSDQAAISAARSMASISAAESLTGRSPGQQ